MFFDCATFMTIWTLRAKLKIQLVNRHMVTWTVHQFTGRCRTVAISWVLWWQAGMSDTMLKGSYASTPACDVSRIFFSQLRWKVSKMSQLYPAKINFCNVPSQNRPLFCFSVLVPETNTIVACLKITFLFRSWLQKTVNSKCLIKNRLCAKLLTLKQTITWSKQIQELLDLWLLLLNLFSYFWFDHDFFKWES